MIPYVLLLAIPIVFSCIAIVKGEKNRYALRVDTPYRDVMQKHNLALPVFFLLFLLMLMLRADTVGRDLQAYKLFFETYSHQSLETFHLIRLESLFRLLNWAVGQITDNYQIFLAVLACITVIPVAILYCQDRRYSVMQIAIFVSMSTFVMMFSGVRQAVAITIGVLAYMCVRQKQLLWFIVCGILALGFHHSAFMIFFLYPLYHVRLKKKHLFIIVPVFVVVFLFNQPLFNMMMTLFAEYTEEYSQYSGSTGAYTMLLLFALFTVFCYIIPDENQMDAEMFGLRNILVFATLMQCFASQHPFVMRLNYYFILFIPMAVAKMASVPKAEYRQVAKLAAVVMSVYFTFDFLYKTFTAYMSGGGALDTIPYVFFWQ